MLARMRVPIREVQRSARVANQVLSLYAVGRVAAVANRPLLLLLTNNYLSREAADALAVVFLTSTLALAAVGVDPHRRFYPRHFGAAGSVNSLPFFLYISTVAILIAIGATLVLGAALVLTGSLLVAAAGCAYFVGEKLADEILRFRLFEQDFDAWGWACLRRAGLQAAGIAIVAVLFGASTPGWLEILVLLAGTLVVFVPQVPSAVWALVRRIKRSTAVWLLRHGAAWLSANWLAWMLALLASAMAYLDRMFALFIDRNMFALFMVVAMCWSSVQLAVEFFYVSRNRRAFLEHRLSLRMVFGTWGFWACLGFGVLVGAVTSVAALVFSRDGGEFPVSYIAVIAIYQILLAAGSATREFPYWQNWINAMVRIEVMFYLLLVAAIIVGWAAHLPAIWIFVLGAGCFAIRLAMYVAIARQADAVGRTVRSSV